MKQSEYLYSKAYNPKLIRDLDYITTLKIKIAWAKQLILNLLEVPLATRDLARINACLKAIDFNQTLIDECV